MFLKICVFKKVGFISILLFCIVILQFIQHYLIKVTITVYEILKKHEFKMIKMADAEFQFSIVFISLKISYFADFFAS